MRLVITIIWCLAALCWLPWALIFLRWLIDLALGASIAGSYFTRPALLGIWPVYGWLRPWAIVSVWPLCALLGMALSAVGWRIYWREQDGRLTRPASLVALSIILPPIAPLIMYQDARRRYAQREADLEGAVEDARERSGL